MKISIVVVAAPIYSETPILDCSPNLQRFMAVSVFSFGCFNFKEAHFLEPDCISYYFRLVSVATIIHSFGVHTYALAPHCLLLAAGRNRTKATRGQRYSDTHRTAQLEGLWSCFFRSLHLITTHASSDCRLPGHFTFFFFQFDDFSSLAGCNELLHHRLLSKITYFSTNPKTKYFIFDTTVE